jgi:hypothetical protein
VYKQFLVVSSRSQALVEVPLTVDMRDRDDAALARVLAPCGDPVDLVGWF